jgi:hypothetical protein
MSRPRCIAVMILGLALVTAAPARAQVAAPAADDRLLAWEYTLYKTLTYNLAGNLSDMALYGLVLGGTVSAGPGFVAANLGATAAIYYAHEYGWEILGPSPADKTHVTIAEKTVLYRALSSTKNFGLGLAFGGGAGAAAGFVAASFVADTAIYLANEYGWDLYRPRAVAIP